MKKKYHACWWGQHYWLALGYWPRWSFGCYFMRKVIGYLVTWTTYGTWVQGDKREYVKNGKILPGDSELEKANKRRQLKNAVKLNRGQKEIVKRAILERAKMIGQEVLAIAVRSNHVHIVVNRIDKTIEEVVAGYKRVATKVLNDRGFEGRVWTTGFDKRFCFDEKELGSKITYVKKHNE